MALDWYQIATLIVAILFGGQGIHSWRKARLAREAGLPATEDKAAKTTSEQYLNQYYQKELEALRGNQSRELESVKRENARLRRQHEIDSEFIDELEAHIWEGKPPPPPRRRKPTTETPKD